MSGSVCKLVLWDLQPAGELLCCEDNKPCLAYPLICSSANRLTRCWFINKLGACKRKDALAKTVCQYQDGVYCLKGVTDQPYDRSSPGWNVVSSVLYRFSAIESANGYSYAPVRPVSPPLLAARAPQGKEMPKGPTNGFQNPQSMVCSDSMVSGICQVKDDTGYKSFSYDVEICNNSIDIINSPPQISNATTTVSTTISIISTMSSSPKTLTATVTASPSIGTAGTVNSLSNHLETEGLPSLLLVILLIIITGNIIGRGKLGILCII
jgi:hypothetical protein